MEAAMSFGGIILGIIVILTGDTLALNSVLDNFTFYNTTVLHSDAVSAWWDAYDLSGFGEDSRDGGRGQWGLLSEDTTHVRIQLSFDFPFYGRPIRDLAISLNGFISASQKSDSTPPPTDSGYIAPLMAEFALESSSWGNSSSRVIYSEMTLGAGNRSELIVRWDGVLLRNRPELGPFSFQAVLQESGDIIFLYHVVPSSLSDIAEERHPMTVGLCDVDGNKLADLLANHGSEIVSDTSVYWHAMARPPDGSCDGEPCDSNGTGLTAADEDDHEYYLVIRVDPGDFSELAVDMDDGGDATELFTEMDYEGGVQRHEFGDGKRFNFYGHFVDAVYVSADGFIALSPPTNDSDMHEFQYIAPLRADYDLSVTAGSRVRFLETEDSFTVEWSRMPMDAKRPFTFQATISFSSGDIVFAYETIPEIHENITAGIANAFVADNRLYEYRTISLDPDADIRNGSVVKLKARETCNDLGNCEECLTTKLPTFECQWCEATRRCSSGMDRLRERWGQSECGARNFTILEHCPGHPRGAQHHDFYNVSFVLNASAARDMWVESPAFFVHDGDSAYKLDLPSPFPFYGHMVHSVHVFPAFGVVSVDHLGLNFVTHGRYMTPLLSSFSLSPEDDDDVGRFAYMMDGERAVVEWREVYNSNGQKMSFQVITTFATGDIHFVYRYVAEGAMSGANRIGISDSYVRSAAANIPSPFHLPLAGYNEYHSINLANYSAYITGDTAIVFRALETCGGQTDCKSCVEFSKECHWCPALLQCSRLGKDRAADEWTLHRCHNNFADSDSGCPSDDRKKPTLDDQTMDENVRDYHKYYASHVVRGNPEAFELAWNDIGGGTVLDGRDTKYKGVDRVVLPFAFPFYGHPVKSVLVSSCGFISLPSIEHANLAESQFIATLMADFDIGDGNTLGSHFKRVFAVFQFIHFIYSVV